MGEDDGDRDRRPMALNVDAGGVAFSSAPLGGQITVNELLLACRYEAARCRRGDGAVSLGEVRGDDVLDAIERDGRIDRALAKVEGTYTEYRALEAATPDHPSLAVMRPFMLEAVAELHQICQQADDPPLATMAMAIAQECEEAAQECTADDPRVQALPADALALLSLCRDEIELHAALAFAAVYSYSCDGYDDDAVALGHLMSSRSAARGWLARYRWGLGALQPPRRCAPASAAEQMLGDGRSASALADRVLDAVQAAESQLDDVVQRAGIDEDDLRWPHVQAARERAGALSGHAHAVYDTFSRLRQLATRQRFAEAGYPDLPDLPGRVQQQAIAAAACLARAEQAENRLGDAVRMLVAVCQ
jgi:hypothetical protein